MFNLSGFIAKDAENEQLSLCGPAVLVYLGWSSLSGVYNHQFTCSAASCTVLYCTCFTSGFLRVFESWVFVSNHILQIPLWFIP